MIDITALCKSIHYCKITRLLCACYKTTREKVWLLLCICETCLASYSAQWQTAIQDLWDMKYKLYSIDWEFAYGWHEPTAMMLCSCFALKAVFRIDV